DCHSRKLDMNAFSGKSSALKHTRRTRGRLIRKSREALRRAVIFLCPTAVGVTLLWPEPFQIVAASSKQMGGIESISQGHDSQPVLSPQSRQRSSGTTFVPMMEPTNFADRDDPPGFGRLDGA